MGVMFVHATTSVLSVFLLRSELVLVSRKVGCEDVIFATKNAGVQGHVQGQISGRKASGEATGDRGGSPQI
jgi:hypothetical protein